MINGETSPTTDQYISLAIAITELAFWDYCDCICDLYCLHNPRRSDYAKKRSESVKKRAMRIAHIQAASPDIYGINKAVSEEKKRLKKSAKRLERFFNDGICGLAFHFDGGNAAYFRELSEDMTESYVDNGSFKHSK